MKFASVVSYILVALVANTLADPQFGGRQGNVCRQHTPKPDKSLTIHLDFREASEALEALSPLATLATLTVAPS